MASVFTELIQNSIDAIRSSSDPAEHKIEVTMNETSLSIYDSVGIPDSGLLAILIPFLSTKSTESMLSTGEMGTGFFNVYRQPYSKHVRIETNNKERSLVINVIPIIKNNRVVDLIYEIDYQDSKEEQGTQITIFFNDKVDKVDLMIRASMQLNVLKLIEYPVFFNDVQINIDMPLVYENEVGKVFYDNDLRFISYIFTNGVPFGELGEYIRYITNEPYKTIISTGFIFDFNSSQFTPTQSRTNIKIKNEKLVSKFINDGLYYGIIKNIASGNPSKTIGIRLNQIFPNFDSNASYIQVVPQPIEASNFVRLINYVPRRPYKSISWYLNDVSSKLQKLTLSVMPKEVIPAVVAYDIPEDLRRAINMWFLSKKIPPPKNTDRVKTKVDKRTINKRIRNTQNNKSSVFFYNFIVSFWEIGLQLEKQGILKGTNFSAHPKPPGLSFETNMGSSLGYYTKSSHEITLKDEYKTLYEKDVIILSKSDKPSVLILDLSIKQLISIYHGSVLIHELSHAWRNSSHKAGKHDDITLTVYKERKNYTFEEAAVKVYTVIIKNGLYDFVKK